MIFGWPGRLVAALGLVGILALMLVREGPAVSAQNDGLSITGIEMSSSPAKDITYGIGETIEFEVTLSAEAEVEGVVVMGTYVGDQWRGATYRSGSGTDTLVFGYEVQSADRDEDGFRVHRGYQDSQGTRHGLGGSGSITDAETGNAVSYIYDGTGNQDLHKVDGSITPIGVKTEITSSPERGETYRYGESVDLSVTFSAALDVEGKKSVNLRVGPDNDNNWRAAWYEEGSGTKTLVFSYTVDTLDLDTDGIRMGRSFTQDGEAKGFGGSGTIKVSGTDIEVPPDFDGLTDQPEHKVNGTPYAKTFTITSTPAATPDTYGRDEVIQISINLGQEVDVTRGRLHAQLLIGEAGRLGAAPYVRGSGTDTLVFEYEVQEIDRDSDGISVRLPIGQNIKASGTEIGYEYDPWDEVPALENQSDHKVDGSLIALDDTQPTISTIFFDLSPGPGNDSTYQEGDWIGVLVRFSERVEVHTALTEEADGTEGYLAPLLELNIGGVSKAAEYGLLIDGPSRHLLVEQRAALKLIFGYVVQEGDVDTDGISIEANKLTLNGARIQDRHANQIELTHDAVADDGNHKVDAREEIAPTVSQVAVTSDLGEDNTYVPGDGIEVSVTFNEDVPVTGTPQLEIDVGGTTKAAYYSSTEGAQVVFSYTVVTGDADSDGIAISENSISLNSGTIQDGAGNDATLTHDALAADSEHKVDGAGPTVDSIQFTSQSGSDNAYGVGDKIQVTMKFSEVVVITGTPQLELDVGGTAKTASYSGTTAWAAVIFSYTVVVGDVDTDGVSIGQDKLSLNGGTILDAFGNAATLTHDAVAADTDQLVSAPGGL